MRESGIVQKIIKAVKARYKRAYVRKLSDRFTRGIPDILIVVQCGEPLGPIDANGCRSASEWCGTLFVETKAKNGKPSKLQEVELRSIIENGAEAIISRDVETVLNKLEQMGAVS